MFLYFNILFLLKGCKEPKTSPPENNSNDYISESQNEQRESNITHVLYEQKDDEDLAKKPVTSQDIEDKIILEQLKEHELYLTKHAKCRMSCRQVSDDEIMEALDEGSINYRKSDTHDKPCPTYAVEDRSEDGQLLRIVFAACSHETKVVTVIDLENDYSCNCY